MDVESSRHGLDEERIIRNCQDGDFSCFGHLVRNYQRLVTGLAYKYLGDREEAKDMAQEVFLQCMLKINRFDLNRKFKTWISTITVRRCIDQLRRRRLGVKYVDSEGARLLTDSRHGKETWVPVRKISESRLFAPLLNLLSKRQRQTLLLHLDHGWSTREIAELLNCTSSTVRGYLFSARNRLRSHLLSMPECRQYSEDIPLLTTKDLPVTLAS